MSAESLVTLVHGTTWARAQSIIASGPDPTKHQPKGMRGDEGFSAYIVGGPYWIGTPEEYAREKAAGEPGDGGPVLLYFDVTQAIMTAVNRDGLFPPDGGLVQFNRGCGLEELLAAWHGLTKRIVRLA